AAVSLGFVRRCYRGLTTVVPVAALTAAEAIDREHRHDAEQHGPEAEHRGKENVAGRLAVARAHDESGHWFPPVLVTLSYASMSKHAVAARGEFAPRSSPRINQRFRCRRSLRDLAVEPRSKLAADLHDR